MKSTKAVGFTGTRSGMNSRQKAVVMDYLERNKDEISFVVHGGCIGADMDFHKMAKDLSLKVHVRPGHFAKDPDNVDFRGDYKDAFFVHRSETHLKRNREIVRQSDVMLAAPRTFLNTGGGTWYTISHTRKQGKPLLIAFPGAGQWGY